MGMPAVDATWTVEMLDALPDDGQRYELIDGMLHVTPAPSEIHQLVAGAFYVELRAYLRPSTVGRAIISPADVRKGDRARNRVQPDVFAIRLTDGKRPPYPYALSDLLLAIEVESPGDPLYDYQTKRALYLGHGVPEYWVVNPQALVVSRWREGDDSGQVFSQRISWMPKGMSSPLEIDLPGLFEDALG